MKQELAKQILQQTRSTYNKMAEEFSAARAIMWQDIEPLLQYSTANDKVLDLGCGNGRLFSVLQDKKVEYVGVDNSEELIKIAKQKYPRARFLTTDGFNLPFKDNSFDKIYCIAVLHHIPSKELRIEFLQEAKRVLKPNGLFVATVWKLGQKKSKLIYKFFFLKLIGRSKLDFNDVLVPWQNKYQRYLHNFTKKGFKKLLEQAGFEIKEIGSLWRPERKDYNLYAVVRKF